MTTFQNKKIDPTAIKILLYSSLVTAALIAVSFIPSSPKQSLAGLKCLEDNSPRKIETLARNLRRNREYIESYEAGLALATNYVGHLNVNAYFKGAAEAHRRALNLETKRLEDVVF
jgi:hypothetical protein